MFPFNLSHRAKFWLSAVGIVLLAAGVTWVRYLRRGPIATSKPLYDISLAVPSLAPASLAKVPSGFPLEYIFGTDPVVSWGDVIIPDAKKRATTNPANWQYQVYYSTASTQAELLAQWKNYLSRTQWIILRDESVADSATLEAKHFTSDLERLTIFIRHLANGGSYLVITFSSKIPRMPVSSPPAATP
jgi:hypothetical protein